MAAVSQVPIDALTVVSSRVGIRKIFHRPEFAAIIHRSPIDRDDDLASPVRRHLLSV
jgi:hypothetical protein